MNNYKIIYDYLIFTLSYNHIFFIYIIIVYNSCLEFTLTYVMNHILFIIIFTFLHMYLITMKYSFEPRGKINVNVRAVM